MLKNSVYAKNAYTASDGKTYQVAFYNLDVVISVGYRVKSLQGTHFRQLYLIGASLKDLGKKCFAFTRLDSGEIERIKKSAFGMLV